MEQLFLLSRKSSKLYSSLTGSAGNGPKIHSYHSDMGPARDAPMPDTESPVAYRRIAAFIPLGTL